MKRFLPEWEKQNFILMALPNEETDWNYILDEAIEQYKRIILELTMHGVQVVLLCNSIERAGFFFKDCDCSLLKLIQCTFNDTWTRDYGPISIKKDGKIKAIDFGFNGWGLKFASDFDNLVNLFLYKRGYLEKNKYVNLRHFILEGGSIETDGKGLILTTSRCLCSPNRNGGLSKKSISKRLKSYLGAEKILFLDHGYLAGDDTDSHVDTLARIAPDNKIIYVGCTDTSDEHWKELQLMKNEIQELTDIEGNPFELFELPLPKPIFDENGKRLPATYANYLITEKHVFMPVYNQPEKDSEALTVIKKALPEHEVIGIDCNTLIKQHGSLHCATMQIPYGLFNFF